MSDKISASLEKEKIGKLLRMYAIPAIIAMTASSLYNLVDNIFVGNIVGSYALSGIALVFPFMSLSAAFGTFVGVGSSTLISIFMGRKDYEGANKILGNELVLNIIIALAFAGVSLLFLDKILYFFGASENTIGYSRDYMKIILGFNVISFVFQGLNHILRSTGHPKMAMYTMLSTVLLNIALNALFMYVLGMGVKGAAYATIISQFVALIWLIIVFSIPKGKIYFRKGIYKLDTKLVKNIFGIGFSPFVLNALTSVIVVVINQQLFKFGGDMALGAYGIINRLWFTCIMIVVGLTQGMQPILGYNYGAQNMVRVYSTLKISTMTAVVSMVIVTVACHVFSQEIISIFTSDPNMAQFAEYGLRVIMWTISLLAVQMVISVFFQSIGKPKLSIILNVIRQLIIFIPLLYILPQAYGRNGILYSVVVSDIVSFITSLALLFWYLKVKVSPTS